MEHSVKIVIGANYGDEGKGLMSRYFTKQFADDGRRSVTVFHNGSAQRGHTVDYENGTRHVFHNFAAGSMEGSITYYDKTFMVHPMDFCREIKTLPFEPDVCCNPECIVVTPADMMADQIIEDYIAVRSGAREYGSCGYGTWSTTDRIKERPDLAYTIKDMSTSPYGYWKIVDSMKEWVNERLKKFQVDLNLVPHWKRYFDNKELRWKNMWIHFSQDLTTFNDSVYFADLDYLWAKFSSFIFEGAQGLMLDKDRDDIWTTTSNTGVKNPYIALSKYDDFTAEVCYVSRSYVTRHGDGPLDNEVEKSKLGDVLNDETNVFNLFQGNLRYATLSKSDISSAISKDFETVGSGPYYMTMAYTHCNECDIYGGDYSSYSPVDVRSNLKK